MGFQYISISVDIVWSHARIQRGDRGSGPPTPESSQKYRISWIPWNSQNYQASIQRWAIIGPPAKRHLKAFRWRADDGPLLVIFWSSLPYKNVVRIQIRSEWNSGKNVSSIKHLGTCKASILSKIRLCRAKADAHEKHLQVSFSAPIHDIFRD